MKLKDVIKAVGKRDDWIKFDLGWEICDDTFSMNFDVPKGTIIPTMPANINVDMEAEIVYYWYDHLDPHINISEINKAIYEHDYKTFRKWYDRLEYEPYTYLPSDACLIVDEECVGRVCIAYNEDVFSLIDWSEHECG